MSMFSDKILKGINEQFEDDGFETIEDVCVNIYLANAMFQACFILEEDEKLLTFVATDPEGREKLKVANKDYIESVEVYYLDDDDIVEKMNNEEDSMFN